MMLSMNRSSTILAFALLLLSALQGCECGGKVAMGETCDGPETCVRGGRCQVGDSNVAILNTESTKEECSEKNSDCKCRPLQCNRFVGTDCQCGRIQHVCGEEMRCDSQTKKCLPECGDITGAGPSAQNCVCGATKCATDGQLHCFVHPYGKGECSATAQCDDKTGVRESAQHCMCGATACANAGVLHCFVDDSGHGECSATARRFDEDGEQSGMADNNAIPARPLSIDELREQIFNLTGAYPPRNANEVNDFVLQVIRATTGIEPNPEDVFGDDDDGRAPQEADSAVGEEATPQGGDSDGREWENLPVVSPPRAPAPAGVEPTTWDML